MMSWILEFLLLPGWLVIVLLSDDSGCVVQLSDDLDVLLLLDYFQQMKIFMDKVDGAMQLRDLIFVNMHCYYFYVISLMDNCF